MAMRILLCVWPKLVDWLAYTLAIETLDYVGKSTAAVLEEFEEEASHVDDAHEPNARGTRRHKSDKAFWSSTEISAMALIYLERLSQSVSRDTQDSETL